MKAWKILVSLLMIAGVQACTPMVTDSTGCHLLSYYGDQTECLKNISSGTCEMTTVNTTDKAMVCWKPSASSGATPTPTGSSGSCAGLQTPWTVSAWSPSACGVGVTELTRTITCNYPCPCNSPSPTPSPKYTCTPDLFNGKHYESECIAKGGSVVWVGTARACNFGGTSCPADWFALSSNVPYTITVPASAEEHTTWTGGRRTVTTGSHASFMAIRETLSYCSSRNISGCRTWSTLYSTVTRVACY